MSVRSVWRTEKLLQTDESGHVTPSSPALQQPAHLCILLFILNHVVELLK